jgi:3-dehydroquinate synthetase
MGAGKSTVGRDVAERTARPFVDTDEETERLHGPIPELFERGEAEFRRLEEQVVAEALAGPPAVIALGGGAVLSEKTRQRLSAHAYTVLIEVDVDDAWERVRGSNRPLARNEEDFRRLFDSRRPIYGEAMDALADDAESVLLAALRIVIGRAILSPESFVVVDERVLALHPLEGRDRVISVPSGEDAKSLAVVERIWRELELDRDGMIIACGGGSTTDVAGFAAATYMRGVPWTAVPTTLVGQVDAGIGGKTAIDLTGAKNVVGAFHWPARVVCDQALLTTLPEAERRNGLAEVVKTGLLAGEPLWELPVQEQVRRSAAFKAAVCLRDPFDRGARNQLNLGHTFAHALEAAAGFELGHGQAVALGLRAALRLSGQETTVVDELLAPEPVRVDRDVAWRALTRDKKGSGGTPRLVLLDGPGHPRIGVELPDADVRAALDELIAGPT